MKYISMTIGVTAIAFNVLAQLAPGVKAGLQSSDWTQRYDAYKILDADTHRTKEADTALIVLLSKEDEICRAAYIEGPAASGKYGEGYSEYTLWLLNTVMKIGEKDPKRSDVWPAIMMSGLNPDSTWYAAHGDKALPFLSVWARGNDPYYQRADALLVLAQIVGYERDPSKLHHLDSRAVQEMEALVRGGLSDTSDKGYVRWQAVNGLALIGTKDDLTLLESIAATDPEFVTDGGQSGKELRYPMRENARRAADKLRQRLKAGQ